MSNWRRELELNARYAVSGIINGIVGLTTIWGLTKLGTIPIVANMAGYVLALSIGFLNAKKFVFKSQGHLTLEAVRYLFSFAICYFLNLIVLYLCIRASIDILIAQGISVFSYVISMYLSSRLFVFSKDQPHGRN